MSSALDSGILQHGKFSCDMLPVRDDRRECVLRQYPADETWRQVSEGRLLQELQAGIRNRATCGEPRAVQAVSSQKPNATSGSDSGHQSGARLCGLRRESPRLFGVASPQSGRENVGCSTACDEEQDMGCGARGTRKVRRGMLELSSQATLGRPGKGPCGKVAGTSARARSLDGGGAVATSTNTGRTTARTTRTSTDSTRRRRTLRVPRRSAFTEGRFLAATGKSFISRWSLASS
jgi:hypothetical protein